MSGFKAMCVVCVGVATAIAGMACEDDARREEIALWGDNPPPAARPAGPAAGGAQPVRNTPAAGSPEVERFLSEMREMTDSMSQRLGLSGDQRQQVTALQERFTQRLRSNPQALETAGDQMFREVLAGFREILTPEQQQQFDALNRGAQQTSLAIQRTSRLRQIGMAAARHAMQHGGTMPDDLGVLVEQGLIVPDAVLDPASGKHVPEGLQPGAEAADWARQNSDYVYLAGGMTRDQASGNFIVAHSTLRDGVDKVSFLLGDGSAHALDAAQARQVLDELSSGQNSPSTPLR